MTAAPRSAATALWLGVAAHSLQDLRDVLADRHDYSEPTLDALMRGKPGNVSRGGGRQNLDDRPDGEYLWSAWTYGRLVDAKKRTRPASDPGGYAAWRYAGTITPSAIPTVLPYADPYAEADAAWAGHHINTLSKITDDRPHRPDWTSATCRGAHSLDSDKRHGHGVSRDWSCTRWRIPLLRAFTWLGGEEAAA